MESDRSTSAEPTRVSRSFLRLAGASRESERDFSEVSCFGNQIGAPLVKKWSGGGSGGGIWEVQNPRNPSKSLIFGRFGKIVVFTIRFLGATLGPHSGHKYLKSRNSMWRLVVQDGTPKVPQKWGPRWVPPPPIEGSSSRLDAIFSLFFASRGTFWLPDSRHRPRHVLRQLNLGC